MQLGLKLLYKFNRHRMGPAPLTCPFTSKERISEFVGIRTACVRPSRTGRQKSAKQRGVEGSQLRLDTNQAFELACRSTYAFVAPSPSVCLKSSFPSLTIFFLSFEKHSTEEAVRRNRHRLTIYLVTQQTTFCSVRARLWFLIQFHVPQLPRIDCTDHRAWSRACAEWEKYQHFLFRKTGSTAEIRSPYLKPWKQRRCLWMSPHSL